MSESAEPSTKRRHSDMDDIPPSMQFFKWAQLGKRSPEAIDEIRSLIWHCKSGEAKDILYMFMKYYDSQMQKEKEYKEKQEKKQEKATTTSSGQTKIASTSSVENKKTTHDGESDVQFLMERRSAILREMNDETGVGVEDSEVEASEDVIDEDKIAYATENPEVIISSPDRPSTAVTSVVQQIPQSPVIQPVIIKEEPAEDKADPTASFAAQIPAATIPVTASRGILKKPKPEPIETSRKTSESTEEPTSPTLSTVAVANEPLTSPPVKMPQVAARPPVALRPKLPSAPTNLMPPARVPVASKVQKHPHVAMPNDAAAAVPKPLPNAESSTTLQRFQKKQQIAGFVETRPRSLPVLIPTEKVEQRLPAVVQASPRKAVLYDQYKQQRQQQQKQQASPTESNHSYQEVVHNVQEKATEAPADQQVLLTAKNEMPALPPPVPQDPVVVAILANNLVALNKKVDTLNNIKELAQAQALPSEYLYIAVEHFADPGNTFTLKYFRKLKHYLSKIVDKIEVELSQFMEPSVAHLQIRLRGVKVEIEGIWERARAAIDVHRVKKKAAYAQRVAVARMENGSSSSSQQRHQSPVKRSRADSSTTSQWVQPPPSKRSRKPLLDAPAAPPKSTDKDASNGHNAREILVNRTYLWSPDKCAFCNGEHESEKCSVYPSSWEREHWRKKKHLCWSCLCPFEKDHHLICEKRGQLCSFCGNHASHVALCRQLREKVIRDEERARAQPIIAREWQIPERRNVEEEEEGSDGGAEFSPQATPIYQEGVRTEEDEKPITS